MVVSDKFLVNSWWSNWKYPNDGTQKHLHCTISQKSGSPLKQMRTKTRIKKTALSQRVGQSVQSLSHDPKDCSMPGLYVHHQLLELTQTHVHWVGDAINHLILCCPLLLLPSIFSSNRVFSNELVLHIRWPKCWSFSTSPSSEYSGWISFRID